MDSSPSTPTQLSDDVFAPRSWPLLTVNILAYNRRDEVRQTLNNLQQADYPREQLEVIVVDNASSDGTSEMIAAEFPDVKVVRVEPNRAVAGWNAGFEAGRGDYFLMLDDDSSPRAGLKEAVAYLESHPQVGVLACNIIGGPFTMSAVKDRQRCIGFIGCGALISRRVVQKIGGFAPWIHLYTHEYEYGLRCLNAGFEIRFFQGCEVEHRSSALNRSGRQTIAYTTRNELLLVHIYFKRHRALYLLRTLFYNAWLGHSDWKGVWQGVKMFWHDAPHHRRHTVRPGVQRFYAQNFWSTQPLLPNALKKIARLSATKAR